MQMTAERRKVFIDWLRRKVEHHACPLCQTNHWKLGEALSPPTVDALDEAMSPPPVLIPLVCGNCAHVLFFDSRHIPNMDDADASRSDVM